MRKMDDFVIFFFLWKNATALKFLFNVISNDFHKKEDVSFLIFIGYLRNLLFLDIKNNDSTIGSLLTKALVKKKAHFDKNVVLAVLGQSSVYFW